MTFRNGMMMLGKFLAAAAGLGAVANVAHVQRFLADIMSVFLLMAVCFFMLCGLAASILALLYFYMIHIGVDPYAASMTIGFLACLTTGTLAIIAIRRLRQMRTLPAAPALAIAPRAPDIGKVFFAFIDGFMRPRR